MDSSDRWVRRSAPVAVGSLWAAWLSYTALIPVLQTDKGLSTVDIGTLGSVGLGATLVGQLLGAPLADRWPARRTALLASAAVVGGLVAFAWLDDLRLLSAVRAVTGIGLGTGVPALTALAIRAAAPGAESAVAARIQIATSIGLAVGPLVASMLVGVSGSTTTLTLIAVASAIACLPVLSTRSLTNTSTDSSAQDHPSASRSSFATSRSFVGAVLVGSAFMVAVGAYDTLWSRYLADLGATQALIGTSYVLFAIPFAALAAAAALAVDRYGMRRTAVAGGAAMVAAMVAYAVVETPVVAVGIGLIESTGQAFVSVASTVAVVHAAPRAAQGRAHGLAQAAGTAVAAIAALISGYLYASGGAALLFTATAAAYTAFLAAGLVALAQAPTRQPTPQRTTQ